MNSRMPPTKADLATLHVLADEKQSQIGHHPVTASALAPPRLDRSHTCIPLTEKLQRPVRMRPGNGSEGGIRGELDTARGARGAHRALCRKTIMAPHMTTA